MKNGEWVVFNGISLECTEYFLRTNLGPLWGIEHCFGGPAHEVNGQYWAIELNDEPQNVANILTKQFQTTNTITKVPFKSPYDQVIDKAMPNRHPLIRLPTTASTYLYDADCVTGNATDYVETIDLIVQNFTSQGIAVSYDYHWSCPQPSGLQCAAEGPAVMPLREFGSGNPGALAYWDAISKKYADNPYVFYELYNEPFLKPGLTNFDVYYNGVNGTSQWVGMAEIYNVIRKNDPTGIIILAGMQQYAFDAATQLAFMLRYKEDYGSFPTNVVFNYHPYQATGQGPEKSIQGALRMLLAGQTMAPVIFTEFGQACCAENPETCPNGAHGGCTNHLLGDNFVYNIVNMAYQYDVSWTGWGWFGTVPYDCDNLRSCYDMRNENGTGVANGTWGGASWASVWEDFVNNAMPKVKDVQQTINLLPNVEEQMGYLPRPCIMGDYNLQGFCGLDLNISVDSVSYEVFGGDSIYQSVLPGMPPMGACHSQGCPSHPCGTSTLCG
eukprot:CAMPEP_0201572168 /NCGR_PEP_ID=MMETSP0190_2-20130828/15286_1 /ASSEMBLY_ACC=CAM_ASM_000263 /TAXON_ID=37353 /ORGANISM="Rosalina sp." /LENGTH=497 /DNA_ID=CAMNT_0047997597 /DNA_START=116 /DNA_END=1609 /DNA_ORIENTATION=-